MTRFLSRGVLAAVAGLGLSIHGAAQAEVLDVNVSGDSARLQISGPLARLLTDVSGEYQLGGIIGEDDRENDFVAGHLGVMLTGDAGATAADVTAGLGARLQYVDAENDSGGALQLGGQAEARLPGYDRFGLSAYVWFGPEATSFGEVDDLLEYGVALDYQILRDAAVYVGYRQVEVDFGQPQDAEEDGVHGGIRLNF